MISEDVGRLIRSIERQSEKTIAPVAELENALIVSLQPIAEIADEAGDEA
jgi:hypothetical protein